MKQFIKLAGMFALILMCALGCKKDHYDVKVTDKGYIISNIPEEVMKSFKEKEEVKITLDDDELGLTSVIGMGMQEGSNSFLVETSEKLKFSPVKNRTWLLMWFGNSSGVRDNCSGCSRDSSLKIYMNDHNMCYCTYSRVVTN